MQCVRGGFWVGKDHGGFAVVSVVMFLVLLSLFSLSLLSLSSQVVRSDGSQRHQRVARENARLALMQAVGQLQKMAGGDRRVTARAEVLGSGEGSQPLSHRNWHGVWQTYWDDPRGEWPVIGKGGEDGSASPYPYSGVYTDLRENEQSLKGGRWKERLFCGWLVSGSGDRSEIENAYREGSRDWVEMVGRGTIGAACSQSDYLKKRVLVEKVSISDALGGGAYAWYVSDNSQKASLSLVEDASGDDPSQVRDAKGTLVYRDWDKILKRHGGKLITRSSVCLVEDDLQKRSALAEALGYHFHDLTPRADGLMTDVVLGGLKKDLTPLLFAHPDKEVMVFSLSERESFSSDSPIIPGRNHAVLGPGFGALRSWGRLKYLEGLHRGEIQAQVEHRTSESTRTRPVEDWPGGIADGLTWDGAHWASRAPKIHPVMTDVRWHYYFSHTEGSLNSLRTHIQPRVCLWNPYDVGMQTGELMVLMPNPFRDESAFHFAVDAEESERLNTYFFEKGLLPGYLDEQWPAPESSAVIAPDGPGVFPRQRYLGFILEPTHFPPGQCLVFSPLVSQADFSAGGVSLKKYNPDCIADQRLSARAAEGMDHYFIDYHGGVRLRTGKRDSGSERVMRFWRMPHDEFFDALDLSRIVSYQPWAVVRDNFPFILKAVDRGGQCSVEDVAAKTCQSFPTLQLMNHGNGGVWTYDYWSQFFGDSQSFASPFGRYLSRYEEFPHRQGSRVHQWGAKLLTLDESSNEGGLVPIRSGLWDSRHWAYHQAPIAHWNVRPGLVTRSPASPCTASWGHQSSGAWMLQVHPFSLGDVAHAPLPNRDGQFTQPALLPPGRMPETSTVLFSLPLADSGMPSLGDLRHACLSPYSWHPSYIVGHSRADLHAPSDRSAHVADPMLKSGDACSTWDAAIAGYIMPYGEDKFGPRLSYASDPRLANSSGLLQLGKHAVEKRLGGEKVTSRDECLAYDIAFEVNQNLWDAYFISGMPMSEDGSRWLLGDGAETREEAETFSHHARYRKGRGGESASEAWSRRLAGPEGFDFAFWNNAYGIKCAGAFNVNSTSVDAWMSVLSGALSKMEDGTGREFSRVARPMTRVDGQPEGVEQPECWGGSRSLSHDEIETLAKCLVELVKQRGPFLSMADFVNRRLAGAADPSSQCGVLDEAIMRSGINQAFHESVYQTSFMAAYDNNHPSWKPSLQKQVQSKAWGIPAYLTQGDFFASLAPVMTVRGDCFTVRCYGESHDRDGKVMARACLQAEVVRGPDYLMPDPILDPSSGRGDPAIRGALKQNRVTAALVDGGLHEVNRKFGRRFEVTSMRWLSDCEI
ncbi:hypothetical protein HW115_10990 [Verrucomicrobiaceae bacterium N1E253]|uniref:Uncharacterized protein n=1 Tax=Oceaniferula marina TaxID=2748318 RepID=A0A851GM54_9BACT|nr:hypothetical protein [Oceaniferula marina]NWK56137.1 hypothetical protein [Oceaniferula marina]